MAEKGDGCQIVSFVFYLFSYGAFLSAFGTTYWMDDGSANWGLWKKCEGTRCYSIVGSDLMTTSFIAAQVLMSLALCMGSASLAAYIYWLSSKSEVACAVTWVAGTGAAFTNFIGIICWGNESYRYYGFNVLSWSFWLDVVSAALMFATCGVTACSTKCGADLQIGKRSTMYKSNMDADTDPIHGRDGGEFGQSPHDISDQEYSDATPDYSMGGYGNPKAAPMYGKRY